MFSEIFIQKYEQAAEISRGKVQDPLKRSIFFPQLDSNVWPPERSSVKAYREQLTNYTVGGGYSVLPTPTRWIQFTPTPIRRWQSANTSQSNIQGTFQSVIDVYSTFCEQLVQIMIKILDPMTFLGNGTFALRRVTNMSI